MELFCLFFVFAFICLLLLVFFPILTSFFVILSHPMIRGPYFILNYYRIYCSTLREDHPNLGTSCEFLLYRWLRFFLNNVVKNAT